MELTWSEGRSGSWAGSGSHDDELEWERESLTLVIDCEVSKTGRPHPRLRKSFLLNQSRVECARRVRERGELVVGGKWGPGAGHRAPGTGRACLARQGMAPSSCFCRPSCR